jgi:hypothetical protein
MNHSYYDTIAYEDILKSFVGEAKMFQAQRSFGGPKVALVSTLVSGDRIAPFVFRSYRLPFRTQSNYKGKADNTLLLYYQAPRADSSSRKFRCNFA